MNIFDSIVNWFASTDTYIRYISQWPAPLNNVSFDAVLLIILMFFLVRGIFEAVSTYRFQQRLKAKQRALREKEVDDELKGKKEDEKRSQEEIERKEDRDLMNQYLKFMMVAQMQQVSSVMGISFDQFKDMKGKAESGELKATGASTAVSTSEPAPSLDSIIDSLTGLYNRRGYDLHLIGIPQASLGVAYVDANNLKKFNDNLGHKYGDKLLIQVANALRSLFPNHAYRIGGDEFVILLEGIGPTVFEEKMAEFKEILQVASDNDKEGLVYSAAVGWCVNDGTMTKQAVIDKAEQLMYEDKRKYKEAHGDLELKRTPKTYKSEETEDKDSISQDEIQAVFDIFNNKKQAEPEPVVEEPEIMEEVVEEPQVIEVEEADIPIIEGEEEMNEEPEPIEVEPEVEEEPETVEEIAEPEYTPIDEIESSEEEPAEEVQAIPDYTEILAKREDTPVNDQGQTNDFLAILNMIEQTKDESAKIDEINKKEEEIVSHNLAALDSKIQSGLTVEGATENASNTEPSEEEVADFERRRAQALKQEEKELAKQEKLRAKEEKMLAKQEAKEARKHKKGE